MLVTRRCVSAPPRPDGASVGRGPPEYRGVSDGCVPEPVVVVAEASLPGAAGDYDFDIDVPAAYRPQGKGRVERQVNIVRDHVLAGRAFSSVEELNAAFAAWVPLRRAKVHGTHGEVIGHRAVRDHRQPAPLLDHPDDDGSLTPGECAAMLPRLEAIIDQRQRESSDPVLHRRIDDIRRLITVMKYCLGKSGQLIFG